MDGKEDVKVGTHRPPPRRGVDLLALFSLMVGAAVFLNEAFLAGTDRPNLIFAATVLIAGGGAAGLLERLRLK